MNARTTKPAAKPAKRPTAPKPAAKKKPNAATSHVLVELKTLAKELNQAAKDLGKRTAADPKVVSGILGNVERMMSEAADKSLQEAEAAKQIIAATRDSLSNDWSRKEIEGAMQGIGGHLTNIIVAQEFQDLAGQAIRKAMKALVGAIVVEASAAEDRRLSQHEVDNLLKSLMP